VLPEKLDHPSPGAVRSKNESTILLFALSSVFATFFVSRSKKRAKKKRKKKNKKKREREGEQK